MPRPAKSEAEKMIKVDHSGENGAVNIYRAQAAVARILMPDLRATLLDYQSHEEEHRAIFMKYLNERGIRKCVSYHLCGLGGFTLGFITALMGQKAVFATTYAVENVVLAHLVHQLEYLDEADRDAYHSVQQIYADELEHHDTANAARDEDSLLSRSLIWIVKLCTNGVIKFGMR